MSLKRVFIQGVQSVSGLPRLRVTDSGVQCVVQAISNLTWDVVWRECFDGSLNAVEHADDVDEAGRFALLNPPCAVTAFSRRQCGSNTEKQVGDKWGVPHRPNSIRGKFAFKREHFSCNSGDSTYTESVDAIDMGLETRFTVTRG